MQLKSSKIRIVVTLFIFFIFSNGLFAQTPTPNNLLRGINDLRYSPDGQWLAIHTFNDDTCDYNEFKVINATTKQPQWSFTPHLCEGYSAWSPSGDYLASVGSDGLIRIWDNNTGIKVMEAYTPMLSGLSSLTWRANESQISAGTGDCLECFIIYPIPTGERFYQFTTNLVIAPAWHPTNPTVIAVAEKDNHIRFYTPDGTVLRDFALSRSVYGLEWNVDGSKIMTFSKPDLWVLNALSGEIEGTYSVPPLLDYEYLRDFSWTDDGKLILASFDRYLGLWDVETGDVVFEKVFQTKAYSRPTDIRMIDSTHYEIVYAEGNQLIFDTVEYGSPTPTPTSTP